MEKGGRGVTWQCRFKAFIVHIKGESIHYTKTRHS